MNTLCSHPDWKNVLFAGSFFSQIWRLQPWILGGQWLLVQLDETYSWVLSNHVLACKLRCSLCSAVAWPKPLLQCKSSSNEVQADLLHPQQCISKPRSDHTEQRGTCNCNPTMKLYSKCRCTEDWTFSSKFSCDKKKPTKNKKPPTASNEL